jgi:hypothetical protein
LEGTQVIATRFFTGNIGDFKPAEYQKSLERLLRHLKTSATS